MANGAKFIAADDMIVRYERREKKTFEPETWKFIKSQLESRPEDQQGGIFVDVGASTGWFTVPVGLMGVQVVAFEPNPRVVDRLRQNLMLNDLDVSCVEVVPFAASNKKGETTFWYNGGLPLTSGGSIEAATCGNPKSETVKTLTIDQWVRIRVSLLKVDVEGHEMAVLDGAEETISRWRPAMVLEANTEEHFRRLEARLKSLNYGFVRADTRNILAVPC